VLAAIIERRSRVESQKSKVESGCKRLAPTAKVSNSNAIAAFARGLAKALGSFVPEESARSRRVKKRGVTANASGVLEGFGVKADDGTLHAWPLPGHQSSCGPRSGTRSSLPRNAEGRS
jgi:hypothetical protein